MTVAELIERLEALPPGAKVIVHDAAERAVELDGAGVVAAFVAPTTREVGGVDCYGVEYGVPAPSRYLPAVVLG